MRTENEPTGLQNEEAAAPDFPLASEQGANWYLSRLAAIRAKKAREKAQAAQTLAQLDANAHRLRSRYEPELIAWTRAELSRRGSGSQSLTLPAGTVSLRSIKAGLKISDAAAALAFARRNFPEAVTSGGKLDAGKYRAFAEKMRQAGADALPVGVEATPAREVFRVTFGGKAESGAAVYRAS